jgi:hypothetical protein
MVYISLPLKIVWYSHGKKSHEWYMVTILQVSAFLPTIVFLSSFPMIYINYLNAPTVSKGYHYPYLYEHNGYTTGGKIEKYSEKDRVNV